MTKTTTNLLLMLITILAGTFFYITCCSECGGGSVAQEPPKEEVAAPITPEATSYPFAFSDGDYSFNSNDNYNFNISSSTILEPLAASMADGISSLKGFLEANPDKVINVTGYYKSDEDNDSAYPNLGLSRANAVKTHLVANGISSSRINTMGELMENMVAKENVYFGPVSYSLDKESSNAKAEMQALYDDINANPLILYFNSAQASINLNATQRQKVAAISKYLDKIPGATVAVVGHTDNTGKASTNMRLGLNRANFAKDYLIKNGIAESKINTSSKGPTEPIETNATEEGRAKNRRTVVTLKN